MFVDLPRDPLPGLGAEMGPDAATLYGLYDTIRTIWTTSETETVQSDVAFSGSYAKRRLELGKLMLYQLSYSRSTTYGWSHLPASIKDATSRLHDSTQRVGLEENVAARHGRRSVSQERTARYTNTDLEP